MNSRNKLETLVKVAYWQSISKVQSYECLFLKGRLGNWGAAGVDFVVN